MKSIELVEELRALRDAMQESELMLFKRAKEIEDTMRDVWRQDYTTFDMLLGDEDIIAPQRYRNYVEATELLDEATIEDLGVSAAIEAAKVTKLDERNKVVEHCRASRATNNKRLSERQAKAVVTRLVQAARESGYAKRAQRRQAREEELHQQNVELKKQVRALEQENREIKAELAKLRTRLGLKKPQKTITVNV